MNMSIRSFIVGAFLPLSVGTFLPSSVGGGDDVGWSLPADGLPTACFGCWSFFAIAAVCDVINVTKTNTTNEDSNTVFTFLPIQPLGK
jgi:hypothetical protein